MAECYLKGGTEHVIIPAVREAYIQPFEAPNWVDLRVGFFLSITDAVNDNLITGLADNIPQTGNGLASIDRYWIGLKTHGPQWPRTSGVVFMGYSNSTPLQFDEEGVETLGDSTLSASDTGIGAGVNYWWPHNSYSSQYSAIISDGESMRTWGADVQQHFPQVVGGAGAPGYAVLHAIRFTRPSPASSLITMSMKNTGGAYSTDILYSSTPTSAIIETNLLSFPLSVATVGPVDVSSVPDALYFYWPWNLSRLRVHAIGVLKFA